MRPTDCYHFLRAGKCAWILWRHGKKARPGRDCCRCRVKEAE